MNAANLVRGDRARPRLPVQPHLRAVDDRLRTPAPGCECPVYSRVNGRYPVFVGFLPVAEALALLVAGEG